MKLSELRRAGHWPTLLIAVLYYDFSIMAWTMLGPLGAQIGESLHLSATQKGLMVAVPILSGAILRVVLGLGVDWLGAKGTGLAAQLVVMAGMIYAWLGGLDSFGQILLVGAALGFAGGSFAVALPQAGRWYPAHLQGLVMGLVGAGNMGTVVEAVFGPRLAAMYGWRAVFGFALVPALIVIIAYGNFSQEAPLPFRKKRVGDYVALLKDRDAHWFCFYYTIAFGGFVGLASSYVIYFKGEFGLTAVHAGDVAALCTAAGAFARPLGGAMADRIGGIRALYRFYAVAGAALMVAALGRNLYFNVIALCVASGALGMATGSVFQLLPQRFGLELGVMTGIVGAGGGIGGFYLASSLGFSKGMTGSYSPGFVIFAALCCVAIAGLGLVKSRWRNTWGILAGARI